MGNPCCWLLTVAPGTADARLLMLSGLSYYPITHHSGATFSSWKSSKKTPLKFSIIRPRLPGWAAPPPSRGAVPRGGTRRRGAGPGIQGSPPVLRRCVLGLSERQGQGGRRGAADGAVSRRAHPRGGKKGAAMGAPPLLACDPQRLGGEAFKGGVQAAR